MSPILRLALETQRDARDVAGTIQREWRVYIVVGYVVVGKQKTWKVWPICSGLVFSQSFDKLVLLGRQVIYNNI